jgi:ABC-type taurine transport system ATPase subunit
MSEFYQRLRPHPVWEDITYKLRGDVQRSLLLQVGDELNPQFIYSSGQRRATGLAFLLAVNMSLSWNNWKSILLDDPVQHIDDFRSVHLAEVLAEVLNAGRQIICAAEDEALADLIARHLPVSAEREGRRVTLGVADDGSLAVLRNELVAPHPKQIFISTPASQTAI